MKTEYTNDERLRIQMAKSDVGDALDGVPEAERPGNFDGIGLDINDVSAACHLLAVKSGWWHDLKTGEPKPVNVGEKLCLIHSEISEAMEGDRKNLMDDKLPHRKMIEVELADAVIRIFDLAGALDLDVPGAMIEKLAYNQTRADHKPENRLAEGGKQY